VIIKPNRGRDWLDWQRKLCSAGKWIGLGALFLMMGALLFGEMGISRYLHLREHAEQLDHELADLQRLNGELRADLDRVQYDSTRIEELARERLGYVRKGETVYQLAPLGEKERLPTVKTP
jgi:cell division protein FtsB